MINFLKISNLNKKIFLFISDVLIIIFSTTFAYSLRLETFYSPFDIDIKVHLIFTTIFCFIFYLNNIYQILIRYFDYFSILKILKSILISFIIILPLNLLFYEQIFFPRSISFISTVLIFIFVLLHRIFINFLINIKSRLEKKNNNILVIGIKNNIELIKNIRQYPTYGTIKAIIDIKANYKKRDLNGIKIFKEREIYEIIKKFSISEIIIGNNSLDKKKLSNLFKNIEKDNIRIKNLTSNKDYFHKFNEPLTQNLNFFNIIDRPKIKVEKKVLNKQIRNKSILVTGGGGSIGSELCLEILKHKPKILYVLEISEINLFNLINKIKENSKLDIKKVKPVLGDCNDEFFLNSFFKKIKINHLYHAAAYKHVNFGEENPYSMIKNNIFSTKKIIEFVILKRIKNFIFISSDKAVNPKSILGYTKKFGEILSGYYYLLNSLKSKKYSFTIVRFGNVIGSSGSVIPIFLNQIRNRTPLTVTNKEAKRYFMSISEAVQLVINASYLNRIGIKIFALNMGQQIKIYNIAKRIVALSGFIVKNKRVPRGDIEIKIIGLKKGEKLSEELTLGKNLKKTKHSYIMECNENIKFKNVDKNLKKIENLMINNKINFIKKLI